MASALSYNCPVCGTPLVYDGLCWKCKSEQSRQTVLAGHVIKRGIGKN